MIIIQKLSKKEPENMTNVEDIIEDLVIKPEEILKKVTDLVWEYDINHIDALIMYCDRNQYDLESVCKIIPASLRSEIEQDAKHLRLLRKDINNQPKLPI